MGFPPHSSLKGEPVSQFGSAGTLTAFKLSEKAKNKAFTGKLYPPKVLFFGMECS